MTVSSSSKLERFYDAHLSHVNDIYSYLPERERALTKHTSKFFNRTITAFDNRTPCNVALFQNREITAKDINEAIQSRYSNMANRCNVAILTCKGAEFEKYKGDDKKIIEAFKSFGVHAEHVIWNEDPSPDWKKYHVVIVRSTWDYTRGNNFSKFINVLKSIERMGVLLLNPLDTILWNSEKNVYLRELAAKQVPCIPTAWISQSQLPNIDSIMRQNKWTKCVIKPTVSAGGANTFKFELHECENIVKRCLAVGNSTWNWMLQPFQNAIVEEGEYSVVLLNGKPVPECVILKKPAKNNFLVQDLHGGTVHRPKIIPDTLLASVQQIYMQMQKDALAARIDVVRGADGKWQVIEAELIEAFLFFAHSLSLSKSFAWAVIQRLHNINKLYACCINVYDYRFLQTELYQFKNKISVLHNIFTHKPLETAICQDAMVRLLPSKPKLVLEEDFPNTITQYRTSVNYTNENEKTKTIEVAAESIASIYVTFLTPDGHQQRNKKLSFNQLTTVFPPANQVENFKKLLKDSIRNELNKGDANYDHVYLSTDYAPEGILRQILEKCGIVDGAYELHKLFPEKTSTIIYRWTKKKEIRIEMTDRFFFK